MTSTTPTVADEIERYLRTGDTDPYHAAWSAPSFLEGAQRAGADLENALVAEVSRRANGWEPPPAVGDLDQDGQDDVVFRASRAEVDDSDEEWTMVWLLPGCSGW